VLSDIRIIAMGAETSDDPQEGKVNEKAKTATFEVTPRQAEELVHRSRQKIHLSRVAHATLPRSRRCQGVERVNLLNASVH
jgi:Flp pilus assembly protein CpaB